MRAWRRSARTSRPSSTACTRRSGTSASSSRPACEARDAQSSSSALDSIETLPPGLYEAMIEDTHPDMPGARATRGPLSHPVRAAHDRGHPGARRRPRGRTGLRGRSTACREINQGLYDTLLSRRSCKAMSNERRRAAARAANPARLERWLFSDLQSVDAAGCKSDGRERPRQSRARSARTIPFVQAEREARGRIEQSLDQYRDQRDAMSERHVQGDLRVAVARALRWASSARHARPPRTAAAPTWEQDGARAAQARRRPNRRDRGRHAARCVGAHAAYCGREGRRGRRAAFQPGAADDRGD